MAEEGETLSEQRIIENYIKTFSLEECLDEILNHVVIDRPKNPYVAIAQAFESKTLPEILDVKFLGVIQRGGFAVRATVLTNLGPFHGTAAYRHPPFNPDGLFEPKDYSVLDGKMTEALIPLDPRNLKAVDDAIASMNDIDPAESLAVSIACCRAGAKYKGIKLFEYIAELANVKKEDMTIPLPVVTLATRTMNNTKTMQTVQLFPVKTSALDLTMNKILAFLHLLSKHEKVNKPQRYSPQGTLAIDAVSSVEELAKLIAAVAKDAEGGSSLKLGLSLQAHQTQRPVETNYTYINETGATRTGQDYIEQLMALWQEIEIISVDHVLSDMDIASLRILKKRIQDITNEAKGGQGDKLKYCAKGIGGDSSCHLQVTVDGKHLDTYTNEIERVVQDMPYNAVKISLQSVSSVSKAIDVLNKGRKFKFAPIVDCGTADHTFSDGEAMAYFASPDDFDVDFAIGIGAVQFHGNGIYEAEFSTKLNRLQDISCENPRIRYVGSRFRGNN